MYVNQGDWISVVFIKENGGGQGIQEGGEEVIQLNIFIFFIF